MKRPVRSSDGLYHLKGKTYKALFGSRQQVWNKTAYKTPGGLTRTGLTLNKWDRIVSVKKHRTAKKEKRLEKYGYFAQKGKFGFVRRSVKKRSIKGGTTPTVQTDTYENEDNANENEDNANEKDLEMKNDLEEMKKYLEEMKKYLDQTTSLKESDEPKKDELIRIINEALVKNDFSGYEDIVRIYQEFVAENKVEVGGSRKKHRKSKSKN